MWTNLYWDKVCSQIRKILIGDINLYFKININQGKMEIPTESNYLEMFIHM